MLARSLTFIAVTLATVGLLASCAENRRTTAQSICSVSEAPPALLVIDEKAQQILRLVPQRDWPQIDGYIGDIDEAWTTYVDTSISPSLPSESEPSSEATLQVQVADAIDELQAVAAQQDAAATTAAAGRLDAAAVELYEHLHAAVSPNLWRLEVLERQILIDLSSDAYDSALRTLDCAQEVWHRVQPRIQIRTGFQAALTLEGQLTVQRTALNVQDRTTAIASVESVLSLIQDIQRLY